MAKLADRIREALKPHLEPDEELRAVGQMTSGPVSPVLGQLTLGVFYLLFVRSWYVGVTQQRVLLIQLNWLSKPAPSRFFAVPLGNIELSGTDMLVTSPDERIPPRLRPRHGIKRATGIDRKEFEEALSAARNG